MIWYLKCIKKQWFTLKTKKTKKSGSEKIVGKQPKKLNKSQYKFDKKMIIYEISNIFCICHRKIQAYFFDALNTFQFKLSSNSSGEINPSEFVSIPEN